MDRSSCRHRRSPARSYSSRRQWAMFPPQHPPNRSVPRRPARQSPVDREHRPDCTESNRFADHAPLHCRYWQMIRRGLQLPRNTGGAATRSGAHLSSTAMTDPGAIAEGHLLRSDGASMTPLAAGVSTGMPTWTTPTGTAIWTPGVRRATTVTAPTAVVPQPLVALRFDRGGSGPRSWCPRCR